MSGLARRPPVSPVGPATAISAAAPTGATRVQWDRPMEKWGWEVMPDPVAADLADAGLCTGQPVAAWAGNETVRRRGSSYHQDIEGWWASPGQWLVIRARRPLMPESSRSRRFRHAGPWSATVTAHQVRASVQTQRWRKPSGPAGPGGTNTPPPRYSDETLDLLPATLRDRLGHPTHYDAIRETSPSGLREQIVAYRRDGATIIVLSAERHAGTFPDPETALDGAPWITTFLQGTLGPATTVEIPGPGTPGLSRWSSPPRDGN